MSFDVVTGAFGYIGRYIAEGLLAQGHSVKTLTGHLDRPNPFGGRIEVAPFNFERPEELLVSLKGCDTLFNTYWIRFAHSRIDFDQAVANSRTMVEAARQAGVRKFVHISITNPSEDSPLPYFRGKARVERCIVESGLSYSIIRPTVVFGPEDILINNIAWLLRRFPLFAIPGNGEYRLQPIFVKDLAAIAIQWAQKEESTTIDGVGPEIHSFNALVRMLAQTVGSRAMIMQLPPQVVLLASKAIGIFVGDVVLTADEVKGLMANLLVSGTPPTGTTRLSEWLARNANRVGTSYSSEIARHYR
ncbi:MAG TPA: NAD(P)H-binding protein [Candidatus Binataceae bacterium]|nr:NAD(P)H-binding protein [Candidatus Binataceae bacterium]